ncbi:NUDIX hydrolase [Rhizobium sp. AG207R]|uniref:NUDIX hydrolase n=1 Tax=Rhizobium sp. AG207R TaxID=2802287 RepID=UPI002F2B88BC
MLKILLVGSRRNGRWGIPKGHIDAGETSEITAARESFEEAGVVGRVEVEIFGIFTYEKDSTPDRYHVSVHLAEVTRIAMDYPQNRRERRLGFPWRLRRSKSRNQGCASCYASLPMGSAILAPRTDQVFSLVVVSGCSGIPGSFANGAKFA